MRSRKSIIEKFFFGSLFCRTILGMSASEAWAICGSSALTEADILEKVDFPRQETKDIATMDLKVETRVCYAVTGCSLWRAGMPAFKDFLVDGLGHKVLPSAKLRFSVTQDRGWVSFLMDGNESMTFIPATSGLDQTIFSNVYLLGEKLKLKVIHRENCLDVSGFGSRTETTTEDNTKVIEARVHGFVEF